MTIRGKRSGQPCIRGLHLTVWDVLSWLRAGMSEQKILDDYLGQDDVGAVYDFAVRTGRRAAVKLLFDENFSRKLPVRLADLYPRSSHLWAFDLLERPDRTRERILSLSDATLGHAPAVSSHFQKRDHVAITYRTTSRAALGRTDSSLYPHETYWARDCTWESNI